MATSRKRVAIVGSGCSGLAALWALKNGKHDVHFYEADETLGGHTNTVKWRKGEEEVDVDTGFIVFNSATYPNFISFLHSAGVDYVNTDMTFGVTRDSGAFEWSGTSLRSLFAQWTNLFSPRMWRLIFDIVRFNQFALDLLSKEDESEEDPTNGELVNGAENEAVKGQRHKQSRYHESIGTYLEREGYSEAFSTDYLIPMTAAVWSTSPEKCALDFPAMTLVRFMWNHHLLSTVAARPSWMTIPGGSKQYIESIMRDFPSQNVHMKTPVTGIEDINGKVILQFADSCEREEELFDHVILAVHGDQAMDIIRDGGTAEEREILSGFHTSENTAVLHSDLRLMPQRRAAWSAWNLLTRTPGVRGNEARKEGKQDAVCLTYNMNILQHLPVEDVGDVLVTLNPITEPDPETVQGRWTYHHPLYNAQMIEHQKLLPRIQNSRGISYAGAWTKYGFHEDGFSSGLKIARDHLGVRLPFEFVDSTFSRGRRPELGVADYAVRLGVMYVMIWIRLVEVFWGVVGWPFRVQIGGTAVKKEV